MLYGMMCRCIPASVVRCWVIEYIILEERNERGPGMLKRELHTPQVDHPFGQSQRASISLFSGLGGGAAVTTRAAAMIVRRVLVSCIFNEIETVGKGIERLKLN